MKGGRGQRCSGIFLECLTTGWKGASDRAKYKQIRGPVPSLPAYYSASDHTALGFESIRLRFCYSKLTNAGCIISSPPLLLHYTILVLFTSNTIYYNTTGTPCSLDLFFPFTLTHMSSQSTHPSSHPVLLVLPFFYPLQISSRPSHRRHYQQQMTSFRAI